MCSIATKLQIYNLTSFFKNLRDLKLEWRLVFYALESLSFVKSGEGVLNLSFQRSLESLHQLIQQIYWAPTASLVVLKNIVRQSESDQENRNHYKHLTRREFHAYTSDGLWELKEAVVYLETHSSRKPTPPLTGGRASPVGAGTTESRQPLPAPPQADRERNTLASLSLPSFPSVPPITWRAADMEAWERRSSGVKSPVIQSTARDWHL